MHYPSAIRAPTGPEEFWFNVRYPQCPRCRGPPAWETHRPEDVTTQGVRFRCNQCHGGFCRVCRRDHDGPDCRKIYEDLRASSVPVLLPWT